MVTWYVILYCKYFLLLIVPPMQMYIAREMTSTILLHRSINISNILYYIYNILYT